MKNSIYDNPRVTVLIAMYNAQNYIKETLDSVVSQTYTNWECIIIDDGSIDSSKNIAKEYCKKDDRFNYYYQTNSGPSVARNLGLTKVKGFYIQYLDSDDILLPKRLEIMVKRSASLPDKEILYSDVLQGNEKNIYDTVPFRRPTHIGCDITFDQMYKKFGLDFLFIPSCVFFTATALRDVIWNPKLCHSEDWDYYLQILRVGYVFSYVDIPLVIYRNTPNSLSKNQEKTFAANYNILFKWTDGNLFSF